VKSCNFVHFYFCFNNNLNCINFIIFFVIKNNKIDDFFYFFEKMSRKNDLSYQIPFGKITKKMEFLCKKKLY